MSLRVIEVFIENVLGIRELSIAPGEITIIEGGNGTGKTSAMEGMKTTLGRGKLATIRNLDTEDDPKVVLRLDGKQGHYLVEKGPEKTTVRQRHGDTQGFEKVPKPGAWVGGLFDPQMLNPISFLHASDKDRVLMLLDALPIALDVEELWDTLGLLACDFASVPVGLHALQTMSLIRESIFKARTGVNSDLRGKTQAVEQLLREIPAEMDDDIGEKITELDDEISNAEVANEKQKQERCAKITSQIGDLKVAQTAFEQRERAELAGVVAEKRAAAEKEIAALTSSAVSWFESEHVAMMEKVEVLNKEHDAVKEESFSVARATEGKKRELLEMRQQQKEVQKARTLEAQAADFRRQAEDLDMKAQELTAALKKLDEYRASLADDLPIKGLEVEGKNITLDGIPWGQTNTSKQIRTAVQLACLRAKPKELPLIFFDGAERLESDNLDLLCDEIKAQGVQAVIGLVKDGAPLRTVKK